MKRREMLSSLNKVYNIYYSLGISMEIFGISGMTWLLIKFARLPPFKYLS